MGLYQGSHAITMDAKGRIAVPSKQRELLETQCGGRVVMTAHTQDRCILLYPEMEWQNILPQIEALPTFNKAALRVQRLLMGYASALQLDSNGRVLVPPTLRDYAGLTKKLMLVGLGRKFELWDEAAWLTSVAEVEETLPEAMSLLSL